MQTTPAAHLAVFSDYRALAWVLSTGRMAFGLRQTGSSNQICVGSILLLHTTTRCFRGAGRYTTGIIGQATVTSPVEPIEDPVTIGSLRLHRSCEIQIDKLTSPEDAVPLGKFADKLHVFQGMTGWRFKLMSAPVALDSHDFRALAQPLAAVAKDPVLEVEKYLLPVTAMA